LAVSRREFLQTTAAAGGLTALSLADAPAEAETGDRATLPQRVLGRIKRNTSILGYGTAPLGSDNTTPEEAERILTHAFQQGITFFDTAPVYGDPKSKYGNAEMKLKAFLKKHRSEVFLVTKVNAQRPSRDGVLEQLLESLQRMGTDYADAVHLHNLGDFDMEQLFQPDGALAGLKEAKRRGWLKQIAASGHTRPWRFAKLIETDEIDLTMVALNFADRHTYDFEEQVFPAAKKHGTAVVAMKVLGGSIGWKYDGKTQAHLAEYHERAIRYALGLPVACAVIGFNNEAETDAALAVARRFKPLSAAERSALLAEGKRLAEARGLYYGPVTG
jgi:aryl-alcohol dehydrogenase-like predicted oxidoreductase